MKYITEWDFAMAMIVENDSSLVFNSERKMAVMSIWGSVNIICVEPKKLVIPNDEIEKGWHYNEEIGAFEAVSPEGIRLEVETISFYSALNIS